MGVHDALITDREMVGMYYARLEQGDMSWTDQLSFEIPSSQDSETHKWIGMPPSMQEWLGGKQPKGFLDFDYSISNKDYESTIEYHERDLAEDKTGQLQVRINEHVDRAKSHEASRLSTLILNGESAACYDGQYYFDTDHTEGDSGTQSNDLSIDISDLPVAVHGSTTAPSVAEMSASILKAIEAMYGFKDDRGEPLNETAKNFAVMVPISLWSTALSAVSLPMVDNGNTNLLSSQSEFKIKIIPNPRLTWTTKFAVFRTDANVKPFITQIREAIDVKILGRGSDYNFNTRKVQVSLEKAGNVGYGLWQGACLVTMA